MTSAIDYSSPTNFDNGDALMTNDHLNAIALACKENYMFDFDRRFPKLVGASRFSILYSEKIAVEVAAIQKALWELTPMQVSSSKLSDDQKAAAIGFYHEFHKNFMFLCAVIDNLWPSFTLTLLPPPSSENAVRRIIDNCRKAMDKLEVLLKERDAVKAKKQAQRERAAATRAAKKASVKMQPY